MDLNAYNSSVTNCQSLATVLCVPQHTDFISIYSLIPFLARTNCQTRNQVVYRGSLKHELFSFERTLQALLSSGLATSSTTKNSMFERLSIYYLHFCKPLAQRNFCSDPQRISATSKQLLIPPNHPLFGDNIECDFQLKKPPPLAYATGAWCEEIKIFIYMARPRRRQRCVFANAKTQKQKRCFCKRSIRMS